MIMGCFLPLLEEDCFWMVKQFQHAPNLVTLEWPTVSQLWWSGVSVQHTQGHCDQDHGMISAFV